MRALLFIALLAYPLVVWLGLARFGVLPLAVLLGVLLTARLVMIRDRLGAWFPVALAAGVVYVAVVGVTDDDRGLKAYPVIVSLALCAVCAWTVLRPPSLIERGLRLAGRDVPAAATAYLRWVTVAWAAFFLLNACISAWTAVGASLDTWALYNGLIAYLAIAALIGLEWLVRPVYKRHVERRGHE